MERTGRDEIASSGRRPRTPTPSPGSAYRVAVGGRPMVTPGIDTSLFSSALLSISVSLSFSLVLPVSFSSLDTLVPAPCRITTPNVANSSADAGNFRIRRELELLELPSHPGNHLRGGVCVVSRARKKFLRRSYIIVTIWSRIVSLKENYPRIRSIGIVHGLIIRLVFVIFIILYFLHARRIRPFAIIFTVCITFHRKICTDAVSLP